MTTLPNNVNFSSFYARSFSSNEMPFEVNSQRLISFFFHLGPTGFTRKERRAWLKGYTGKSGFWHATWVVYYISHSHEKFWCSFGEKCVSLL